MPYNVSRKPHPWLVVGKLCSLAPNAGCLSTLKILALLLSSLVSLWQTPVLSRMNSNASPFAKFLDLWANFLFPTSRVL